MLSMCHLTYFSISPSTPLLQLLLACFLLDNRVLSNIFNVIFLAREIMKPFGIAALVLSFIAVITPLVGVYIAGLAGILAFFQLEAEQLSGYPQ